MSSESPQRGWGISPNLAETPAPAAPPWRRQAFVAALVAPVFVADLFLPLGVAIGVAYLPAVLVAALGPRARQGVYVAWLCVALTLLGWVVTPDGLGARLFGWEVTGGAPLSLVVATNRLLSVFVIGLTAWLVATRREVEEALTRARVLAQTVVDTAVDAILIIDPRGTVLSYNQAAERHFGWTAAEVIGQNVKMLMPSPYREEHDGYLERYLRTGEKHIIGIGRVAAAQRKDGSVFPIALAVSEAAVDGERVFTGVVHDLTEIKQAEAALESRAAELARSNRELQDFATVASHDLQEPLRKVQAFADRLEKKHGDELSAEARDYLERMTKAAARMRVLINDLLTFSRVTTRGKAFVDLDLGEVLRDVLTTLDVRVEETGAQVEVEPLPRAQADPSQMRQLFQNLLGNALKFSKPGEPPRVRVRPVTASPGHVGVRVEDEGIGFDMQYVDRIFTIFQRLHGRTEYEGTGIGLAVCRKIAERHGGTLTAESAPGQGAAFTLTLPRRHGGSGHAPRSREQPAEVRT